eukprot:g44360.t1
MLSTAKLAYSARQNKCSDWRLVSQPHAQCVVAMVASNKSKMAFKQSQASVINVFECSLLCEMLVCSVVCTIICMGSVIAEQKGWLPPRAAHNPLIFLSLWPRQKFHASGVATVPTLTRKHNLELISCVIACHSRHKAQASGAPLTTLKKSG